MKEAVKALRSCGVKVVHAAQLRVWVARTGRSGSPVLSLESSVRGLYITLDFWPQACSAIVEILKDTVGHYLFEKDLCPPLKATEIVLTIRLQLDFFLVSSMGPYTKRRSGTFDIGLE